MASKEDIILFLKNEFPQSNCIIEAAGDSAATVRQPISHNELRPGNTVAGPVLMKVADIALYVAILAEIGIVPLTLTTSLTINFLRAPSADKDIIGKCKLLKLGKRLAVGEVALYSDNDAEPVAHVVGTYSIPPR